MSKDKELGDFLSIRCLSRAVRGRSGDLTDLLYKVTIEGNVPL